MSSKYSSKKRKNIAIGLMGVVMGVFAALSGAYHVVSYEEMTDQDKIIIENRLDRDCKISGSRAGFTNREANRQITFFKSGISHDEVFSNMLAMHGVLLSCQKSQLVDACVGWECDRRAGVTSEESMPFYFTVKNASLD